MLTVRMSEHFVLRTIRQGGADSLPPNPNRSVSDVQTFYTADGPLRGADRPPTFKWSQILKVVYTKVVCLNQFYNFVVEKFLS